LRFKRIKTFLVERSERQLGVLLGLSGAALRFVGDKSPPWSSLCSIPTHRVSMIPDSCGVSRGSV